MIDLRHPLVALVSWIPWAVLKGVPCAEPAHRDREGRVMES